MHSTMWQIRVINLSQFFFLAEESTSDIGYTGSLSPPVCPGNRVFC